MSRKTEFKGTAASRRRAHRAELQSLEASSADKLHRPHLHGCTYSANAKPQCELK